MAIYKTEWSMESMVYLQEAAPISEFDFQRKHPHPHDLPYFNGHKIH